MGFIADNCSLRLISKEPASSLASFVCSKAKNIEDFFLKEAQDYEKQMMGQSYGFFHNDTNEMVCAFCLANSSVSVDDIPKPVRNKLNRKIPHVKQRETYPAVLLAQLAVSDKYAKYHIGDELMSLIKVRLVSKWQSVSGRFLIADAVNSENVLSFYERNNFKLVFASEDEERKYCNIDADEFLKTRFMITDLKDVRVNLGI